MFFVNAPFSKNLVNRVEILVLIGMWTFGETGLHHIDFILDQLQTRFVDLNVRK